VKRPMTIVVASMLIAAVAMPGVAAANGNGQGKGAGQRQSAAAKAQRETAKEARTADLASAEASRAALKAQRRAEKAAAYSAKFAARDAKKAARKVAQDQRKAARALEASGVPGSVAESGSAPASAGVDATRAVGPGVSNAFVRITGNLEKSVAKVTAGTKKRVPPGLVRVWLKFATWLGIDKATMPVVTTVAPPAVPTRTVEPTRTVDPTSTVEPTPTVEPTVTPAP